MTTLLWMNVPLMVLAFALTVAIPARMILRDARKQAPALALAITEPERVDDLVAA
jgi:hypothetical protein